MVKRAQVKYKTTANGDILITGFEGFLSWTAIEELGDDVLKRYQSAVPRMAGHGDLVLCVPGGSGICLGARVGDVMQKLHFDQRIEDLRAAGATLSRIIREVKAKKARAAAEAAAEKERVIEIVQPGMKIMEVRYRRNGSGDVRITGLEGFPYWKDIEALGAAVVYRYMQRVPRMAATLLGTRLAAGVIVLSPGEACGRTVGVGSMMTNQSFDSLIANMRAAAANLAAAVKEAREDAMAERVVEI